MAADAERLGVGRSSRLTVLLELLAEEGRLSVVDAAQALDVSEATVRRDFNSLAQQQLVKRTHGGIIAASLAYGLPVRYRGNDDAKAGIAEIAAALVRPGEVVGFNGGTTTSATARRVAARSDFESTSAGSALTVVTNALNIAADMVLRPHIRTVSLGGIARPNSYELVGPLATMALRELWLDHLFLGVDGFSSNGGASCYQEGEAAVSSAMVERATRVTVVAGGEKLGRRTFSRICDCGSVSSLVTDGSADEREVARIRALGVEVLVA